jgi:NADH-quinone oxidoreductase subunit N
MFFHLNFYLPTLKDLFPYAGESLLALGILLFLLHFTFLGSAPKLKYPLLIEYSSRASCYLLVLVSLLNFGAIQSFLTSFNGALVLNFEILVLKNIIIFLALLILLVSEKFFKETKLGYFEYNILFLSSLFGCLITLSSNDFLSLYISLEIQALAFYIMATVKKSAVSSEAGLKYFIIGSFSSALLLFGISLIILLTGHYNFENIALFLYFDPFLHWAVSVGAILIILALCIKLALAPFHEWVADVYEGIPTPTALFFATVPKISNFFILTRLVHGVFANLFDVLQPILISICILSLIFGCLNAFKQQNIKRFLAFSSVNHFGFIFMGLILGTQSGIASSFFYLSFYIILTFGMWTALIVLTYVKSTLGVIKVYQLTRITELGALIKTNPGLAFSIFLTFLSMGAIPPLAGFNAKVSVFYSLIYEIYSNNSFGLNLVLIFAFFSSLLSVFYYLRIIKILSFVSSSSLNDTFVHTVDSKNQIALYVLSFIALFNISSFILFL